MSFQHAEERLAAPFYPWEQRFSVACGNGPTTLDRVGSSCQVVTSHRLIVLSHDPEARTAPSGEKSGVTARSCWTDPGQFPVMSCPGDARAAHTSGGLDRYKRPVASAMITSTNTPNVPRVGAFQRPFPPMRMV